MKAYFTYFLSSILLFSSFIYPIIGIQNNSKVIHADGRIIVNDEVLDWLHTEGSYIKDESGKKIILRGVCLYEVPSYIDHLKNHDDISTRIETLKNLGINSVRIPIHKSNWDLNIDSNGDGIGSRDFYYNLIDMLTEEGIYVFTGLHYGVNSSEEQSWAEEPQILIDWYINNIINRYLDNPGVNIYIWNEPHYNLWGGDNIGGGITSGYWDAMKYICQSLNAANDKMLMIVHADMLHHQGFIQSLRNDPIPVPNVVYTWHYYYSYGPGFDPYNPWMSGVEDPEYEYLKNNGRPFYQSYAAGNFSQAKQEFEQSLYERFLWVAAELNLPIISDEFGFTGNEMPVFSYRVCDNCGWYGPISSTVDENNNRRRPPFEGVTYCPQDLTPIPQPQPHPEPGWPTVMMDFLEILEKYNSSWNYFAWWGKTPGGYGASNNDMTTLSITGDVLSEWIMLAESN